MSSLDVRTLVRNFIAANSAETLVDLTGQYQDFRKLMSDEGVQPDAPWLGLEFIGDSELPVSLHATNDKGQYREIGRIVLHICAVAKIGVGASIESRADVLHKLFKGQRIGGVVVESIIPLNTGPGATLEFEGGYISGTMSIEYYYDSSPS